MLKWFGPTSPPIGLEVGAESVKLLQLACTSEGFRVAAALRVAIPSDVKGKPDERVAFASATVRDALRRQTCRFTGANIVAALPKELLHYKTHRLAMMSAEEVEISAKIDARDLFRFDPDSADVQCIDAGEVRQGIDSRREVILIAAGKQYVNEFTLALHRAGARVQSLSIDPCALWRAAARGNAHPDAPPRILLDIGAAQSRLVIGRGDAIRVVKTIDVGADHIRTAISRKLGFSVEEAEQLRRRSSSASPNKLDGIRKVLNDATRHVTELLAREVLAYVRYHAITFRGPAPKRIELVGGDANDAQIRAILSATLMLPAKPVDVFHGIDISAMSAIDRTASMGEWAVALGLALKGLERIAAPVPKGDADSAKLQAIAAEVAHA